MPSGESTIAAYGRQPSLRRMIAISAAATTTAMTRTTVERVSPARIVSAAAVSHRCLINAIRANTLSAVNRDSVYTIDSMNATGAVAQSATTSSAARSDM